MILRDPSYILTYHSPGLKLVIVQGDIKILSSKLTGIGES